MKTFIGIASVYNKTNYGTVLQAYATQQVLDNLGYPNHTFNIDIIEKELGKKKKKYFFSHLFAKNMLSSKKGMVIKIILRRLNYKALGTNEKVRSEKFNDFLQRKFRFTPAYKSVQDLKDYVRDDYSAVIVGSDQIWLPQHILSDYYTLGWVPDGIKRVSLSSSFGKSVIDDKLKDKYISYLNKLDAISVREEAGARLVKSLVGKNPDLLCDPVMMIPKSKWKEISVKPSCATDDYIFCYFLGKNIEHRKEAERLRSLTGYKIVSLIHMDEYIPYDETYADETPFDIGPAEFLGLIANAQYVLTDSFHGTAFSIIFEKNFWVFNRFSDKSSMSTNSRIVTLLSHFCLQNRLISRYRRVDLLEAVSVNEIQRQLELLRLQAEKYICDSLGPK